MLLGSRIIAQRVTEEELKESFRAIDDGRSFWEHAEAAGYEPARWRECSHVLDDLTGWIEMHIEQARVLQDTGNRIGIVNAIAGYVHADVVVHGRGDHAGATPMDLRLDPDAAARRVDRRARAARACGRQGHRRHGRRDRGRAGDHQRDRERRPLLARHPRARRRRLPRRRTGDRRVRGGGRSAARHDAPSATQRQTLPATPMDARIVDALETAAAATGEPYVQMHSGAAHDTMCVADRVPTAMVFVPCKDGISHHPAEDADPADAAVAAEIILNAIRSLQ